MSGFCGLFVMNHTGLVEEVEVVFVAVPTGGIGTCNAYESEAILLV